MGIAAGICDVIYALRRAVAQPRTCLAVARALDHHHAGGVDARLPVSRNPAAGAQVSEGPAGLAQSLAVSLLLHRAVTVRRRASDGDTGPRAVGEATIPLLVVHRRQPLALGMLLLRPARLEPRGASGSTRDAMSR